MATEHPTPAGPASPDLAILESRVYRGPKHLVLRAGDPPGRRPGQPRGIPQQHHQGLHRPAPRLPARAGGAHLLPRRSRRLCGATARGHLDGTRGRTRLVAGAERGGHDLRRGKTRQVEGKKGIYNVVYGYIDERVGLAAGILAVRLVNHLVQPEPDFDFGAELDLFLGQAERTAFGPSTSAILEEAVSRDIPWIRLNEYSLIQLGQGVHAQRIRATMTSMTGALAVDIAGDKDLTGKLLASAGLPVPRSEAVRSVDAAVSAAEPDRLPLRREAA